MKRPQTDPIIAEVWTVRDQHAARFDYDVKAIFRDIQARQEASGCQYVRYPARCPAPESVDRRARVHPSDLDGKTLARRLPSPQEMAILPRARCLGTGTDAGGYVGLAEALQGLGEPICLRFGELILPFGLDHGLPVFQNASGSTVKPSR